MKTLSITKGYAAIVDDEVYDAVSEYSWQYSNGYAKRLFRVGKKRKTVYLHRYIYDLMKGLKFGLQIDHINGDKLDCRMENMRLCTCSQNQQNRKALRTSKTGVKGLFQKRGFWCGEITTKGKRLQKSSKDREVVIAWLDETRKKLHGDFARN